MFSRAKIDTARGEVRLHPNSTGRHYSTFFAWFPPEMRQPFHHACWWIASCSYWPARVSVNVLEQNASFGFTPENTNINRNPSAEIHFDGSRTRASP